MGEFDLSLINEFRIRPSFYDRNSTRFRDKIYNAHQWREISNKLGFDVSILKDRILQLRNRYNLEKRRIEQLREENPNKFYDSPWPLYEHLHFLSDHIRARRSYRKMVPLNGSGTGGGGGMGPYATGPELSNSCSNNSNLTLRHVTGFGSSSSAAAGGDMESGGGDRGQNSTAFPNGLLSVKLEDDSETEAETESQNNESEIIAFETAGLLIPNAKHSSSLPLQYLQQQQQHSTQNLQQELLLQQHQLQQQHQQQQQQQQKQPTISMRRLDSLRQNFVDSSSSIYNKKVEKYQQPTTQNDYDSAGEGPPAKKHRFMSTRELRYAAFGNFVSSSLNDLPYITALELVEKFTSDIVKVLMENAMQQQQQQLQQQQQQQCNEFEN